MVLSVDLPAELGPRLVDRAPRRDRIPPTADAPLPHQPGPPAGRPTAPPNGLTPMFVFDAGYDPIALTQGLADTRRQCWSASAPTACSNADPDKPKNGGAGRPRRHGPPLRPLRSGRTLRLTPSFAPRPTLRDVQVRAWPNLHPKLAGRGRWAGPDAPPIVRGTVIRVDVEHLPNPPAP